VERRRPGSQGPEGGAGGVGWMGMSEVYGTADEGEAVATLHLALDPGVTLPAPADMYGPYKNEEHLGRAAADRREEVVLATKFGIVRDAGDATRRGIEGKPEYVHKAIEGSLGRLGVDHVDLYYQDRVDPDTPIEETVGAMAELVREGKVRYLGLSEAAPDTIRRAHAVHPISALQTEFSLWTRDPEERVLPTVRDLGIGFVAYSPLGRGFLSGRIRSPSDLEEGDFRRHNPRFQGENFDRNLELVESVREIAEEKGVTAAQLALAWVLAHGEDIVPIPGTKRRDRLEENVAAVDVDLTKDELDRIESAFPKGATAGARYPDMSTVNR